MAKTIVVKPLGLVLRKAGLISSEQVEKALQESLTLPECKLGEILAIRGWIKPETADFFAETWPRILIAKSSNLQEIIDEEYSSTSHSSQAYRLRSLQVIKKSDPDFAFSQRETGTKNITGSSREEGDKLILNKLHPLGQYLKAASLINDRQIAQILNIQRQNTSKFGKIAVEKQIISQTTLEFFLEHLNLIKTGEKIDMYPEHVALELDRVESYLLNNQRCEPVKILQRYEKIRKQKKIVFSGDLIEQELLASGIVVLERDFIKIAKSSYVANFNEDWLEKNLASLQPYNQIRLKMFDLDNKAGISYKILNLVNHWTNHQPFLSQKLYQLIQEKLNHIPSGQEEAVIEELTYKHIIDNWQGGVAAKHFQSVRERIFNNEYCSAYAFLQTYKKIWQLKEINANNSLEQRELLRIGLIKLQNNQISVSNLIYQSVFDRQWIDAQIKFLEQTRIPKNSNLLDSKSSIVSYNKTTSSKTKYILPILGIIAFLLTIPFLLKLINSPSPDRQNIERKNIERKNIERKNSLLDANHTVLKNTLK